MTTTITLPRAEPAVGPRGTGGTHTLTAFTTLARRRFALSARTPREPASMPMRSASAASSPAGSTEGRRVRRGGSAPAAK